MTRHRLLIASVGFLWIVANTVRAEEVKLSENVKCPVSGKPAKAECTAKYLGKNVYFCCENCPVSFKESTEKFAVKANHQLAMTGQVAQVACPITGKPCKKDTAIDVLGLKVAFCCPNCQGKVSKADDAGKLDLVFAKLDKGFTLQAKCPVSGKPINPEVTLDHEGKKVYFCCKGCPAPFQKDPAKYASKLN